MSSLQQHSTLPITLYSLVCGYLVSTVRSSRDTHHKQISLDAFPNPLSKDNIPLCGRERESFICDPDQFLKAGIADEIDEILFNATKSNLVWCSSINEHGRIIANPEEKTRNNYNGLQIGVAVISSFTKYSHSRLRRADDIPKKCTVYAKSIHDQWGVGEAGCNNAALIFINVYDRYLYVSTGSGIKQTIKDDFIDKFIIPRHVRPLMRAHKYGEAVKLIVESLIEILASDDLSSNELYQQYIEYTKPAEFLGISYETWFIIILVLLGAVYLGYKFYSERDYRECERKLARLHAQKMAKKFAGTSCPICLEEFPDSNSANNSGENVVESRILICGHKFCKTCLDSWFNSQSAANQKCPICRHDRDDWSAVDGSEEKKSDEIKRDTTDEKKSEDLEEKGSGVGMGQGQSYKTSTSDTFYDESTGTHTNTNANVGNGFGFRHRGRNRYGNGMGMSDWLFQQELMFRMTRMRHFYPRYVTSDMTNRWSRPGYTGSFTRDQSFMRSNPNYRPPQSSSSGSWSSGGRSSGFSFGGGSSSGGGGGGGGW